MRDFGEDVAGNDFRGAGEGEGFQGAGGIADRLGGEVAKAEAMDVNVAGFFVKSAAVAGGAGDGFADIIGGAAALFFDQFGFEDGIGVGGIEVEIPAVFRDGALAATGGAGPVGAVEGKEAGIEVIEGTGAAGAGAVGVEDRDGSLFIQEADDAVAEVEGAGHEGVEFGD